MPRKLTGGKPGRPQGMTYRAQDQARDAIKVGLIVARLNKYALAKRDDNGKLEEEMTDGQVAAARLLLAKALPDMVRTEHTGLNGGPVQHEDVTNPENAGRAYLDMLSGAGRPARKPAGETAH